MNPNTILNPGTILHSPYGVYKIVKVLGQGGFGITYLVLGEIKFGNVTTEAKFAIKEHFPSAFCYRQGDRVIPREDKRSEYANSNADFVAEAKKLQNLGAQNYNIVKVNEVFEANGTAYYVMQYINGQSLQDYVASKQRLKYDDVLKLMRPIIDAVDFLHRSRINHLDIKPDNIMLHEGIEGTTPILIDFGLSVHYDSYGRRTSPKYMMGVTEGYAPIEQYAGINEFSPTADIYAIAATLVYALTGRTPKSASLIKLPELRETLAPLAPTSAINAICNAMAKNSDQRTASIFSLRRALGIDDSETGFTVTIIDESDDVAEVSQIGDIGALAEVVEIDKVDEPKNPGYPIDEEAYPVATPKKKSDLNITQLIIILSVIAIAFFMILGYYSASKRSATTSKPQTESADVAVVEEVIDTPPTQSQPTPKPNTNPPQKQEQTNSQSTQPNAEPLQKQEQQTPTPLPAPQKSESEILAEAKAAYDNKDYEKALTLFRKIDTNAVAQFYLSIMYERGWEVTQSDVEAVRWLRKAADQGYARAQYNLGLMYRLGINVSKDEAEAVRWLRKAANQGYVDAQCYLGVMYVNGLGVTKDDAEAARWFRKAAEQGDASAQNNLGYMYATGKGVTQDAAEAVRWYRKSAAQGNQTAKDNLKELGYDE